jgi:rhomboid protease GluP
MVTKTFGKRGAVAHAAAPALEAGPAAAVLEPPSERSQALRHLEEFYPEKDVLAMIPILTLVMIAFLLIVFGAERRLAFDIAPDGALSIESLLALGAMSYDLVIGSGEVWRVLLAPLLHASYSHFIGNAVAMFFVGIRLEPMIGRGWFAALFAASALGGVAGSLFGNPHDITTVGASGAITGLIGALFAVSFNPRAEPEERRSMLRTALFFGVPALLPLAFGASGHVDYFAHAGGALAGVVIGLGLNLTWHDGGLHLKFARRAAAAAMICLAGSALSCAFAAAHYSSYAAKAAILIPSSQLPEDLLADAKTSEGLLSRYPKDPRAHIVRALYLADKGHSLSGAETELRAAMALASAEARHRPLRDLSQAALAAVLKDAGRHSEARAMAAELCASKDQNGVRQALVKEKLCN